MGTYTNFALTGMEEALQNAAGEGSKYGLWLFISLAAIGALIAFYKRFARR